MGMIMTFTQVADEELDRIGNDEQEIREYLDAVRERGAAHCDLDKSWDGLRYLISAAELGFDLLTTGRSIGDDGSYGTWDAGLVQRCAERFRDMPFESLAPHFDIEAMDEADVYPDLWYPGSGALDYLRDNYRALTEFFAAAAAAGSGAVMSFG